MLGQSMVSIPQVSLMLLLTLLDPVPGSPLLSGLSDLSRMLQPAASLLQTTGTTAVTGGTTAVTTVPVVTTMPAPAPPAMMTSNILPVIFAVAVIKALILGKYHLMH